jgi:hypothetical protein
LRSRETGVELQRALEVFGSLSNVVDRESLLTPSLPIFRASVDRRIFAGRFTEPCCATVF